MIRKLLVILISLTIATTVCLSGCGSFNGENSGVQGGSNNPAGSANNPGGSTESPGGSTGNTGVKLERFTDNYFDAFDTVITLIAYSESEKAFREMSNLVHKELRRYHYMFDIYQLYDGLNNARTVNKNAGKEPVEVAPEFIELMDASKEIYEESGGKTNIAMGSVLLLWHEAREASLANPEKAYIPDMEELKKAAEHCSFDDIVVDREKSTVFLKDPEMSIDLGAIAKGFAIEKIVAELEEAGYSNFVISAGGNVRASGLKGDGSKWVIAVQNPDTESEEAYIDKVELTDKSLVTSGVYRRFYEYEGKRYHHILDPETLTPENRYLSVSILTKDSGRADALSTAVFNMDLEEGQAFIESLDDVEALWVMPDESIIKSSGWVSGQ